MTDLTQGPRKTRELQSRIFDSTIWNDFRFRQGDIIIATHPKAGTTWMQQIVAQLLFEGDPDLNVSALTTWVDMRVPPKAEKLAQLEAQTHRRFLKTHLPADALVFSPLARYVFVGRGGRDVLWSYFNHHTLMTQAFRDTLNNLPNGVGPPLEPPLADVRQFWRLWLDRESYPTQSFWELVRSWWALRDFPDVLLVHYANLKRDLTAEIRRVAAFLDIPIRDDRWDAIVEHCTFDWMKAHANESAIAANATAFAGGAPSFFHQGVNGRWSETLTPAEVSEYEARALRELGPDCAHWLATGELPRDITSSTLTVSTQTDER